MFVLRFIAASEVVIPIAGEITHHRLLGEFGGGLLRDFVFTLDRFHLFGDAVVIHADVFGINLVERGMLFDCLVHQGLGDGGVVHFAVAVTAIADEVDDDIGAEFVAVLGGNARDAHDRIDVLTVDMENRDWLTPRQLRGEA